MGALTFLFSFFLYVWTAYPTVTAQDAGELMVGPATLSIVHPPGYSLYAMLGYVWDIFLPLGNEGFRINLFSAVMTAFAVWGLYKILRRLTIASLAAVMACLFAVTTYIWNQADSAEVYALNLMCGAWILYLLSTEYEVRGTESKNQKTKWIILFFFGISLTNHHLMLMWMPVLIWLFFGDWKTTLGGVMLFGLGLCLYLYLPLRSLANPAMDWGNPESWDAFWNHVLRRQYAPVAAGGRTWEGFTTQIQFVGAQLWNAWTWFLPVAGWGAWHLWRAHRAFAWRLTILSLSVSVGVVLLTNMRAVPMQLHQVQAFFGPAILCVAIWIGLGFGHIQSKIVRLSAHDNDRKVEVQNPKSNISLWILPGALACVVTGQTIHQLPAHNHQHEHIVWSYARDVLRCLPEGSPLAVTGDFPTFPLAYTVLLERYGRSQPIGDDLGAVFPLLRIDRTLVHTASQPVFTSVSQGVLYDRQFEYIPEGLVYRVETPSKSRALATPLAGPALWRRLSGGAPLTKDPVSGSFSRYLRNQYYAFGLAEWTWGQGDRALAWTRYQNIIHDPMAGDTLIQTIGTLMERRGALAEAQRCFEIAAAKATWSAYPLLSLARIARAQGHVDEIERWLRLAGEREPTSAQVPLQLGNFFGEQGRAPEAIAAYERAIALDPNLVAARKNLGALYLDVKQLGKAVEVTQDAIRLAPGDYQLYANLGTMFHAMGDQKRAVAAWEHALQLHPNDPQLMRLITQVRDRMRQP